MKQIYLDIMEYALSAYDMGQIEDYIADVERHGLSEHGFPRLASNIGILMANDRCMEYKAVFCRMMDLCCSQFGAVTEDCVKAGNDFSIREVCCCLAALEGTGIIDDAYMRRWKSQLANLSSWDIYHCIAPTPDTPVDNWGAFAAVSDFVRGKFCNIDTLPFVEHQIASQLLSFDENGMYRDPNEPMLYDYMARTLFAALLHFGYRGIHLQVITEQLDKVSELSLKMQSVTGELPFGGRSNQFLFGEMIMAAYFEMEAVRYASSGNQEKAGRFKAAAGSAARCTLKYLQHSSISHVKNRYSPDSRMGCESYAYFNKYMITVASNAYLAYLFADDSIPEAGTEEAYIVQTSEDFHKTFLRSGGYFLEFDTNADLHYDANGLGRIHKKGCPGPICLSVPFSPSPNYRIEQENPCAMSICGGDDAQFPCRLLRSIVAEDAVEAVFKTAAGCVTCSVSSDGVDVAFDREGFFLPVFAFDGEEETQITLEHNAVVTEYQGAVCICRFDGVLSQGYRKFYNRNGRYHVYEVKGKHLHIEIRDCR